MISRRLLYVFPFVRFGGLCIKDHAGHDVLLSTSDESYQSSM